MLPALLAAGLVAAALAVVPSLPHAFEAPKDAVVCLVVGTGLSLAAVRPTAALPRALAAPLVGFLTSGVAASAAAGLWTHALVMDAVGALLFVLGVTALGVPAARAQLGRALVVIAGAEAALAAVQLALGPAALHLLGSAPRRAYAFGTLGVANWVGALAAMALPPALLAPSRRRLDTLLLALLAVGLVVSGSERPSPVRGARPAWARPDPADRLGYDPASRTRGGQSTRTPSGLPLTAGWRSPSGRTEDWRSRLRPGWAG
jgi:hypothetical protein